MKLDVTKHKSPLTQLLLTVLFGPVGLLYSSLTGACLTLLALAVLAKDFGWHGVLFAWVLAVATGFFTVRGWNKRAAKYGHTDSAHASSASHA